MRIAHLIWIAVMALFAYPAQGSLVDGSHVSVATYCCSAQSEPYRTSNFAEATIGNAVEFPNGSITPLPGQNVPPVTIEITSGGLGITFNAPATLPPGDFDGFVFAFTGA